MRLHDLEMNLFSKEAINGEMKIFECDHNDVEMAIDIAELSSLSLINHSILGKPQKGIP